jgi:mycothiol system anti-sigma-R factor
VDPALAERITNHLSDCSPCSEKTEFRRHLKELVASRCIEREVPDALRERIRTLIADACASDRTSRSDPNSLASCHRQGRQTGFALRTRRAGRDLGWHPASS